MDLRGDVFSSRRPQQLFPIEGVVVGFDVTADGQRFLVTLETTPQREPIQVIVNWDEQLEDLAPGARYGPVNMLKTVRRIPQLE